MISASLSDRLLSSALYTFVKVSKFRCAAGLSRPDRVPLPVPAGPDRPGAARAYPWGDFGPAWGCRVTLAYSPKKEKRFSLALDRSALTGYNSRNYQNREDQYETVLSWSCEGSAAMKPFYEFEEYCKEHVREIVYDSVRDIRSENVKEMSLTQEDLRVISAAVNRGCMAMLRAYHNWQGGE